MHAKSGWPLAFAAAIICLLVLIVMGSRDLSIDQAPTQASKPSPRNLVQFAATINAADLHSVPETAQPEVPFQFPTSMKSDPTVSAASDLEAKSPVVSVWQIDLNPEVRNEVPGGLLPRPDDSSMDKFEPIEPSEIDRGYSATDINPFQFNGSYQAEDIATRDINQVYTQERLDLQELENDSIEQVAQFVAVPQQVSEFTRETQEPEKSSPFRAASGPVRVPHIKRGSEVVVRPQTVSQPIAEIVIPEWDPKAAWPKPTALVAELERLEQFPETAKWAAETKQLTKVLHGKDSVDDSQCEVVFEQFAKQLESLNQIAISVSTTPVNRPEYAQGQFSTELRSLHYDIARRLMVWMHAYELARQDHARLTDLDDRQMSQMILASHSKLSVPGVGSNWSNYLLLDDLQSAFNSLQPNEKQQRDAARATLARLYSSVLSQPQKQYLDQRIDDQFLEVLRMKASENVEPSELLRILEKHESASSGYTNHRLNEVYQSLLWSSDPASQNLAGQLEGHYRNANFRVSVSDRLINRLIPQTPEIQQPISETIMGAQVQGNSRIQNRLLIRLIPDNRKVNLRLESNGMVRSLTQARRSGFVIENVGHSRFQVFKRIGFHREGVESDAPYAVSDTESQVVGMSSNLDQIPVVGWVARRIARNKIQESAPMTDQITREKLEQGAKEQIETEVQSQLARVSDYLFKNILQPLIALDVEPTPLEMRTTQERIIMRYRLAGRDQMASHTARPRALADSLLSVQFHESVFNNLLDRIEISGREFTAQELTAHLQNVFRSQQATGSNEVDHDAMFVFAPYDPMRIEFKDSKIEISLNLRKFRVGKGKTWKNLTVRATFNPQVDGTKLILARDDEGIRLKGANLKLRDHVAVRAVFTALFRDHYEMNVLPEKFAQQFGSSPLAISQLVLNDGWLGLSLSDAPRTAATFSDHR